MLGFIKKLLSGDKGRYDSQKKLLETGDAAALQAMAAGHETHPEILYYLAQNPDADIRRAVASNVAAPVQAAVVLARDTDEDIRVTLVSRLVALLPELSPEKHSQLYAYAVQALGMLAQDEVFQVRRALSSVLRDQVKAPPIVVSRLARDVEREVSEPILRFCVALSDDELLDILKHHPADWVVSAVAARPTVSAPVSEAIVQTGDIPGTAVLLNNAGANIGPATLHKIIEHARHVPEWRQPIALRKEISLDLARQLAGFVDEAVLNVLEKRSDFDAATKAGIAAVVKRRMDFAREGNLESPIEKVKRFATSGALSADVIQDALAWHEDEFVILALAQLSQIHPQVVKKMLSLGIPKPVVALCWRAKVPMRLCVELQKHAAKIPPQEIMNARGGSDYPMPPADIKWQLEFFGIKA